MQAGTAPMDEATSLGTAGAPDADKAEGPSPGAPVGEPPRDAGSQAVPRPGEREVPSVDIKNGYKRIKPL